jgi:hypothetical protein
MRSSPVLASVPLCPGEVSTGPPGHGHLGWRPAAGGVCRAGVLPSHLWASLCPAAAPGRSGREPGGECRQLPGRGAHLQPEADRHAGAHAPSSDTSRLSAVRVEQRRYGNRGVHPDRWAAHTRERTWCLRVGTRCTDTDDARGRPILTHPPPRARRLLRHRRPPASVTAVGGCSRSVYSTVKRSRWAGICKSHRVPLAHG